MRETFSAWTPASRLGDRGRGAVSAAALTAGLLAAALYNTWVLGPVLDRSRDPSRGFVSELGARTAPHHDVFNGLQCVNGLALVVLAALLAVAFRGRPGHAVASVLFGLFAVCNVLDGLFPMDCSPSQSAVCARAEDAGRVSWPDRAHTIESATSNVALLLAMAVLTWTFWTVGECARTVATVTGLLVGPLAGLAIYEAARVLSHHLIGLIERVTCLLTACWLAVLGVAVSQALRQVPQRRPGGPPAHRPAARRRRPAAAARPASTPA